MKVVDFLDVLGITLMVSSNRSKMNNEDEFIGNARVRKPKLTAADIAQDQHMFLKKLASKMEENGHTIEDLANVIGVPYSYIVAIKNGIRRIVKADEATVEKFADYLDVPLVQIYIWGGLFRPVDFISKRTIKDGLKQAFEQMCNDPLMATIVPSALDWNDPRKWSEDAQLTLTRLYEMLSNRLFLEHASVQLDKDSEKIFLNYIKKY